MGLSSGPLHRRMILLAFSGILVAGILRSMPCAAHAGGQKWALLVGVDRYENSQIKALECAGADAREVGQALRDASGFPADHVFVMTSTEGDPPTSRNVLNRLAKLKALVAPGDTFIFFFSGHGVEKDGERYLLTSDTIPDDLTRLRRSALPTREVQQTLQALRAARILQLVDACANDPWAGRGMSAGAGLSAGLTRDLVLKASRPGDSDLEAAVTLFSCKVGQRSYEGYRGHGYFSYFLVTGLRGAAREGSGAVTVPSLVRYLQRNVPTCVKSNEYGGRQDPEMKASGTHVMDWELARAAAASATGGGSAPVRVAPSLASTSRPPARTESASSQEAPPKVTVTAPVEGFKTTRERVTVAATITAGGRLDDVSVSVNGQEVPVAGSALKKSAFAAMVDVAVPLEIGDNTIVVAAMSASGQPAQAAVTVQRAAMGAGPEVESRARLVEETRARLVEEMRAVAGVRPGASSAAPAPGAVTPTSAGGDAGRPTFAIGQRVCARWIRYWFEAVVSAHTGDTYSVHYSDNTNGAGLVPSDLIPVPDHPDLRAGDRVLAMQSSMRGFFWAGVVTETAGSQYRVLWDMGGDSWVPAGRIVKDVSGTR